MKTTKHSNSGADARQNLDSARSLHSQVSEDQNSSSNAADARLGECANKTLGSDLFCQALADQGVEVMFGIPGGVVLPLYDKLNKYGHHIRHILPRHEQGGGFAADGYARVTGNVGVALGTSGPGATNLLTSLANAMLDSIPVVFITGQVGDAFIGTDAFQETDVIGMTMPVVKHSYLVTEAKDVPRVIKEAFYLANTGRPGPIHIDVVKDVWFQEVHPDEIDDTMDLPGYHPAPPAFGNEALLRLEDLLNSPGTKPVILAGHGVELAEARDELIQFSEKHQIPVINTLLGLGTFPQDHPYWVGMIGMHGDAITNHIISEANLVISIGCRFDDRITGTLDSFTKGKLFVHMEIDPSEINKIVPTELPLLGDLKETLARSSQILHKHEYPDWWKRIDDLKAEHGFLDYKYCLEGKDGKLSQARILSMLSDITEGEAIVASDVGRHQMWLARFYRFKHPNSHLSSGGLGSMGFGLPAAMGAKLAAPHREVWAISGDGGFMMNCQELATLSEYDIDVNTIIMEDRALGMVRQWQNLLFKGNLSHSEFKNPDFVAFAESFGLKAWRAHTYEELEQAIKEARAHKGPTLITAMVDPDEHIYPMVPPGTSLADQALCDADLLQDKAHKYDEDALIQGHT
jgi:acetolactate synthase I/II/III large subunit